MKFVVALLLNYVAAIQLNGNGVNDEYVPGDMDSGHYSWKHSGEPHITNATEWVADTPKGYEALKIKNKDIKLTGNELVDEENRLKEKKAAHDATWNQFDGTFHIDEGKR